MRAPTSGCSVTTATARTQATAAMGAMFSEQRDQHTKTTALVELRRDHYRLRIGRELTDDNVWIRERPRELHSL